MTIQIELPALLLSAWFVFLCIQHVFLPRSKEFDEENEEYIEDEADDFPSLPSQNEEQHTYRQSAKDACVACGREFEKGHQHMEIKSPYEEERPKSKTPISTDTTEFW